MSLIPNWIKGMAKKATTLGWSTDVVITSIDKSIENAVASLEQIDFTQSDNRLALPSRVGTALGSIKVVQELWEKLKTDLTEKIESLQKQNETLEAQIKTLYTELDKCREKSSDQSEDIPF
jgi:chaperonin cofactor prefoldin